MEQAATNLVLLSQPSSEQVDLIAVSSQSQAGQYKPRPPPHAAERASDVGGVGDCIDGDQPQETTVHGRIQHMGGITGAAKLAAGPVLYWPHTRALLHGSRAARLDHQRGLERAPEWALRIPSREVGVWRAALRTRIADAHLRQKMASVGAPRPSTPRSLGAGRAPALPSSNLPLIVWEPWTNNAAPIWNLAWGCLFAGDRSSQRLTDAGDTVTHTVSGWQAAHDARTSTGSDAGTPPSAHGATLLR
ncbi:hypothetical protein VTO73DRAFT_7963 [Trametes versicolor]